MYYTNNMGIPDELFNKMIEENKKAKLRALDEEEAKAQDRLDFIRQENIEKEYWLRNISENTDVSTERLLTIIDNQSQTIDIQSKQLDVLKDVFASQDNEEANIERIKQLLTDWENDKHPLRDFFADKVGDLEVGAIQVMAPMVFGVMKEWLTHIGIL